MIHSCLVVIVRASGVATEKLGAARMLTDLSATAFFDASVSLAVGDEIHCDLFDEPRVVASFSPLARPNAAVQYWEVYIVPRSRWVSEGPPARPPTLNQALDDLRATVEQLDSNVSRHDAAPAAAISIRLSRKQIHAMAEMEFRYITNRLFPKMAAADQSALAEQLTSSLRIASPPLIFLQIFFTVLIPSLGVFALAAPLFSRLTAIVLTATVVKYLLLACAGVASGVGIFVVTNYSSGPASTIPNDWRFRPYRGAILLTRKALSFNPRNVRSLFTHEAFHRFGPRPYIGMGLLRSEVAASAGEYLRKAELFHEEKWDLRPLSQRWLDKALRRLDDWTQRTTPNALHDGYVAAQRAFSSQFTGAHRFDALDAVQQMRENDQIFNAENYSLSLRMGGVAIAIYERHGSDRAWKFIRALSKGQSVVEAFIEKEMSQDSDDLDDGQGPSPPTNTLLPVDQSSRWQALLRWLGWHLPIKRSTHLFARSASRCVRCASPLPEQRTIIVHSCSGPTASDRH